MTGSDLVIALHGTRHPAGRLGAERLREAVAAELPGVRVELGWVDIHDERLTDTVRRLGRSVIVPAFMAPGYHVHADVGAAVLAAAGRAVATDHLGPDLLGAIADRLRETGPIGDAVVLGAIGSRRPEATAAVRHAARRLSGSLGVPVRVGFCYAGSPTPAEAVAELREAGCTDISVAVHALFPGRYRDHLDALGLPTAQPIGAHPRVVAAIVRRYRARTALLAA